MIHWCLWLFFIVIWKSECLIQGDDPPLSLVCSFRIISTLHIEISCFQLMKCPQHTRLIKYSVKPSKICHLSSSIKLCRWTSQKMIWLSRRSKQQLQGLNYFCTHNRSVISLLVFRRLFYRNTTEKETKLKLFSL